MKKDKKAGMKGIVQELYQVYGYTKAQIEDRGIDGFSKKLSKYFKMIYRFDCGEEFELKDMKQSSYDKLLEMMIDMTKQYTIGNLETWCIAKNPYQLYWVKDSGQIDFYWQSRYTLMNIYQDEREKRQEAMIKRKERIGKLYTLLKEELQLELCSPQAEECNAAKLGTRALLQQLDELKTSWDSPKTESDMDTLKKHLEQIVDLYAELRRREPSKEAKAQIDKECKPYKDKLLQLRGSTLKFHKEKEQDYLKLSIENQKPMFPYDIDAFENRKQKLIYEECLATYKPLDVVIKEATKKVNEMYIKESSSRE